MKIEFVFARIVRPEAALQLQRKIHEQGILSIAVLLLALIRRPQLTEVSAIHSLDFICSETVMMIDNQIERNLCEDKPLI